MTHGTRDAEIVAALATGPAAATVVIGQAQRRIQAAQAQERRLAFEQIGERRARVQGDTERAIRQLGRQETLAFWGGMIAIFFLGFAVFQSDAAVWMKVIAVFWPVTCPAGGYFLRWVVRANNRAKVRALRERETELLDQEEELRAQIQ